MWLVPRNADLIAAPGPRHEVGAGTVATIGVGAAIGLGVAAAVIPACQAIVTNARGDGPIREALA